MYKYLFCALCLLSTSAHAYFKCVNAAGVVRWVDKHCAPGETETEFDRQQRQVYKDIEPRIGMTAREAVAMPWPWGEPEKINTTETSHGTREQWVYAGHRYLYFTDNVLTAIQK